MNFELDSDQREILGAVETLLERHAGHTRATELARLGEYDAALDDALAAAGFDEVMDAATQVGSLEATMIVEAIAREAGVSSFALHALAARATCGEAVEGPVALGMGNSSAPIRFAAQAKSVLWLDGEDVRIASLGEHESDRVQSNFGFPLGRISPEAIARGRTLGAGSGARLRTWWRLALAAETVGTMSAALDQTVAYLKERRQFGQPIGAFQAVQHRLADCAVRVEGSRLLTYEAAYHRAPDEATACAAAYALESARLVFRETHQLSGAIGFTREHPLHVWSMRLHALGGELGGVTDHRRALARARWDVA